MSLASTMTKIMPSSTSTEASGKPSRIGYKTLGDGRKVRVSRRSGEVIDR